MVRRILILILILAHSGGGVLGITASSLHAQRSAADSLRLFATYDSLRHHSLNGATAAARFNHYYELIVFYGYGDSLATYNRLDTLLNMVPQDDQGTFLGRVELLRANLQRYFGNSEAAKRTLDDAIREFTAAGDSNYIATALYKKSRYYLPARQYDSTLLLAQQAHDLFRATNDPRGQLNTLNAMGMVQRRLGNLAAAHDYFARALPLSRTHADRNSQITVLTNLAIVSQSLEDFTAAETYYREGLELATRVPIIRRQVAYLRTNLSGMYTLQQKYDIALTELKAASSWFQRQGSKREKTTVQQGLANLYQKLGRPAEALPHARTGLNEAGEQQALREQAHEVLALVYRDLGMADSTYAHQHRVSEIRAETARKNQEAKVAELETRFQTREKQLEIDRLEAEEIAAARRLRNRNFVIGVALVGLLLLGWLLWKNLGQRRRIEEQNAVITKALGEKELLLKEIHHRVKNNLQMVSSLLNMQTHYIEDEAAADALQLGRSRVRSMALIHQKLYVTDEVSTLVDAKDYLERLVREVIETHAPLTTRIDLQLDVEPLELDIDTVVPLGLLTNEAVTNAVKYAFTGRERGHLAVRLWQRDGRTTLTVADDGPGLRQTTDENSFGSLLMTTLAEQLDGNLEVKDGAEGVEIVVRF